MLVDIPPILTIPTNTGGASNSKIEKYIPTSYIWSKIKKHVQKKYRDLVKSSLESQSTHIKDAFKDVFRVVNCDALTFFDSPNGEDTISEYLQKDFSSLLLLLCEKIPNKYATAILQNYLKSHFTSFINILDQDVFNINSETVHSVQNFESFATSLLTSEKLKPEVPKFNYDKSFSSNTKINEYVDKLEKCCKATISDSDRSPDEEKIPEILKVSENAIHLTLQTGLDGFLKSFLTPSKDKQYIELPVFEVFKKHFMQCSNDVEFLAELFNMYSARSITFMQKIEGQFFIENQQLNEYIIKFILTKHPYTVKIISECIKHTADLKLTLKPEIEDQKTRLTTMNIYCGFLIYAVSSPPDPTDADFFNHLTKEFENETIVNAAIIARKDNTNFIETEIVDNLSEKHKAQFSKDLKRIFALNGKEVLYLRT